MILLNDGWSFAKGKPMDFTPVKLPHDWLISDVNNLYADDIGWYRRELRADFLQNGQRLFLRFDGVYMDSTLFVNDIKLGEWKYGYTAFEYDITDYIDKASTNILLLKVNYIAPNSRWYTGAGIYRDVFLIVKNNCFIVNDGIYITTYKQNDAWHYEVEAEVESCGKPYELHHTLIDADDELIAWDINNPHLYTLRSELVVDGYVMDTVDTRFGFRTIEFTTDNGFYLNGRQLKLNGVCLHHDLGALGAAVYPDAIIRQLKLLREMGVNAIRTSHNPPAKVFMELADEMGFLVMSEILDMWIRPKTTYDYARFFEAWIEKDVASWIRRDRNHPSLIMWSVGNEIYDTHADAKIGGELLTRLIQLVKKHDPKEHAPATLCSNYMAWVNTQKCADLIKLVGYNYSETLYPVHHGLHPDWIIYGAETCSTVQSRGIYHFPLSKSILADDDLQCSSLGNSSTSWGAKSVEACIAVDRDTSYSLGQFIWAGQDYIGEPTPYHTKSSYLGHIDTAGFPKDSYYLFQAAWTSYMNKPMVHVYPYWDFSPGQLIDIRVCSNAPMIELFLNDKSMGAVELTDSFVADWQIPYSPGTLRAVAYNKQGDMIAESLRNSFGDVADLKLSYEVIGELMFVTIEAIDNNGNIVENANCRVNVAVEDGILLGLDNGDSTDYDQYQTNSRRLFSGKLLAIVKTTGKERVTAAIAKDDIPIRKIELITEGYNITAHIFPENATYCDLDWRLTDAGGIDSPLGKLEISKDGTSATLIPKGNGMVFIRCTAKNGLEHINLISQITMNITGMGELFLDPYSFISGGLCSNSNVVLTNGNERGIATLRDGESHVGFENLDFGAYGSDELTLLLFPLDNAPFSFELWEGMPLADGTRICTLDYDKGSIWNTYQKVIYKLPRRLCGVTTLCLVFRQKVHIKGFQFTKYDKAFQRLYAAESDIIYGDTYRIMDKTVESIGNNVSLIFENMDFGSIGARDIALSWRSGINRNSIQLVFTDVDGSNAYKQMLELSGSDSFLSTVIPLSDTITGNKTVSLIFLPGCSLDLEWIQFKA